MFWTVFYHSLTYICLIYQLTWFTIFYIFILTKKFMPLIKKYKDKSDYKDNLLFNISLIILATGILFLIVGNGINSSSSISLNDISSSNDGLISIPQIGHIDIIKDSSQYVI